MNNVIKRFSKYFHKLNDDNCWVWRGGKTNDGYGKFWFGKTMKAHKVSYLLFKGKIFNGFCVIHNCDNPLCVNPKHLRLGTQIENIKDRELRRRGANHGGENCGMAKLTWKKVAKIRELHKTNNYLQRELGEIFGIERSTISKILLNKHWKV